MLKEEEPKRVTETEVSYVTMTTSAAIKSIYKSVFVHSKGQILQGMTAFLLK